MPTTPSRFSRDAVERYLDAMRDLITNHGHSVTWVRPAGSTETFAARFRDAIRAQQQNAYDVLSSTEYERLLAIGDDYQVSQFNDLVCFGQRSLVRKELKQFKPSAKPRDEQVRPNPTDFAAATQSYSLGKSDAEVLFAVYVFLKRGLLTDFTLEQTDVATVQSQLSDLQQVYGKHFVIDTSTITAVESVDSTVILINDPDSTSSSSTDPDSLSFDSTPA